MSMYRKVFRSLFYGSLTGQSDAQHVFMCLIVHTDRDGHVELPPPVISTICGLPLERVELALAVLESPDPDSRSDVKDGRRLEATGKGRWYIINHQLYQGMRDDDERMRQNREAQTRSRSKRQQLSALVSRGQPSSAHGDGDGDGDGKPPAQSRKPATLRPIGDDEMPTINGNGWKPTPAELATWIGAYPAVSVPSTLKQIKAWLVSNPTRRKTYRGMPRFVNSWLGREQDQPRASIPPPPRPKPVVAPKPLFTPEEERPPTVEECEAARVHIAELTKSIGS